MKILILDDEHLAVRHMTNLVSAARPGAEIAAFRRADQALESAASVRYDVAFLDINLREMTGIEVAKALRERQPRLNIIFVTGYNQYAMDAFHLHACGYILKPVSLEQIRDAFDHLSYPIEEEKTNVLTVHTFGYFDVFNARKGNEPVVFRLAKAKEMFAVLVDRRGELCTAEQIIARLWDDGEEVDHSEYYKRIRQCMLTTLADLGCEDVLVTAKNGIGVVPQALNCDYYDYLNAVESGESKPRVITEYMTQYKWSEETFMMLHDIMDQKTQREE